jgi:hypothetical protein
VAWERRRSCRRRRRVSGRCSVKTGIRWRLLGRAPPEHPGSASAPPEHARDAAPPHPERRTKDRGCQPRFARSATTTRYV